MMKDDQSFQAAPTDAQTNRPTEPPTISDADYEQMCSLLYAYRFGAIDFLELLDRFERIMHIRPSQVNHFDTEEKQ